MRELVGQTKRVFDAMEDGKWITIVDVATLTEDPPACISAQMRHLRKVDFGAHTIDKRKRADFSDGMGLYEYQLRVNPLYK